MNNGEIIEIKHLLSHKNEVIFHTIYILDQGFKDTEES